MITAGVDGGSRAIKVAVMDGDGVLSTARADQGIEHDRLAGDLYDRVLSEAGLGRGDVERVVATGYTRNAISFADRTVTEISCHAVGVRFFVPDVRTIVEIGGQDSKVLKLAEDGTVRDFSMNDRCAAGTGRFLEMVAGKVEAPLDDLGKLAEGCECPASISSMCVVFAETEIIGLLATGTPREEIVAGVQQALARRVVGLVGRAATPPVVFTGGVALVPGLAVALEVSLGLPVSVSPRPELTGAVGAAILARRPV